MWAQRDGAASFAALSLDQQAVLEARLIREMRRNTYDPTLKRIIVSDDTGAAFHQLAAYYANVFSAGRREYAIPAGALTDPAKQQDMAAFFWWTSWAAHTDRPGSDVTYTNNWPHESLVANAPTPGAVLWSILSFVVRAQLSSCNPV